MREHFQDREKSASFVTSSSTSRRSSLVNITKQSAAKLTNGESSSRKISDQGWCAARGRSKSYIETDNFRTIESRQGL